MSWFEIISEQSFDTILTQFQHEPGLMVLHSALLRPQVGRYSFICMQPFARFEAKNGEYLWNGEVIATTCPWAFIQTQLDAYQLPKHPDLPSFQGGAVGYFGYEFTQDSGLQDEMGLPSCVLNFYENVLAYDHETSTLFLIATGFPALELDARKTRATAALLQMGMKLRGLSSGTHQPSRDREGAEQLMRHESTLTAPLPHGHGSDLMHPEGALLSNEITSNFTQAAYMKAVADIQTCILNGDIFQANFTQQFQAKLKKSVDHIRWYQHLCQVNPAPFSALMRLDDHAWILSASPERFVSLVQGVVTAEPIKGTRKRVQDVSADQLLQQELLSSEKDRAENVMIVDLMRNDLSKVCEPGSIEVSQLCGLHSFETVHHLISTVKGRLAPTNKPVDLLKATFPPGSVTGAPKMKAMEVIRQMENTARGPYCGCFGYASFTGDLDMAVTIRTYVVNEDRVYFGAGGGIVLGSDPLAEYEESLAKAVRLKDILE